MNKYRAKTKFIGYKIGLDDDKMYVGIPEKKLNHTCMVIHDKQYMIIKKGEKPVAKYFQEGKRNENGEKVAPDFYLCYFPWQPYRTKTKKEEINVLNGMLSNLPVDKIRELRAIVEGKIKVKKG
jgi:hypothetical protein